MLSENWIFFICLWRVCLSCHKSNGIFGKIPRKYDKIVNMKKKKTALLAGLLGAGVLTASAQFYRKVQEDRKKAQALQEVRDFFAIVGEIATVYVDETASTQDSLVGGVVMEAGQVFLFENAQGSIQYREEERWFFQQILKK